MDEFQCRECGYLFEDVEEAQEAVYGDGCPECGGLDIDLYVGDITPNRGEAEA